MTNENSQAEPDAAGGAAHRRPEDAAASFDALFTSILEQTTLLRRLQGLPPEAWVLLESIQRKCLDGRATVAHLHQPPPAPHQKPRPADTPAPTAESPPPARILIMDDEPEICSLLRRLFTRSGYDAVCVLDGEQAIKTFAEARQAGHPFDLVMMDLTIPNGVGGQEAVSGIHAISPDAPCLAASGFADEEQAALNDYGFQAFIAKPFDIGQLRALVASLLR